MARTLIFEDYGQDFLEWDLDDNSVIVDCRPLQGWFWEGNVVLNAEVGQAPLVLSTTGAELVLKYPVAAIKE